MKKLQAATQLPIEHAEDEHDDCRAVGQILDRIGDKWTVMVVGILSQGPMRFNALLRAIGGVSHRMLTLTLRALERDGLVKRTAYATIPPKVEYELTDLGRSLIGPLRTLANWVQTNRPALESARKRFEGIEDASSSDPTTACAPDSQATADTLGEALNEQRDRRVEPLRCSTARPSRS